jgi:hypothetical protein
MAHESAFFLELREALTVAGLVTQEFFCFGNWYFPVEGRSYANYLSGRPSALQNTLRRKSEKLEQSGHARIEIVTGQTDSHVSLDDPERRGNRRIMHENQTKPPISWPIRKSLHLCRPERF